MTELKDILRTEKNLNIKDGTVCLIVYEEQGKAYIGKNHVYNDGFCTNGVKALLTEDEVLDLVDKIGDYLCQMNFDGHTSNTIVSEPYQTSGTIIFTDPHPKGLLKHKFSVRRFKHFEGYTTTLGRRSTSVKSHTIFSKPHRGEDIVSCRYEKYAIINSAMVIQYILWKNLMVNPLKRVLTGENYD